MLMNHHIGLLFSVRCVLELLLRLVFGGVRVAGFSLQNENHQISAATKAPTHNELRTRDRCGNSSTQPQVPEDGYINVRNMLST